jgi:hypothetical protein
MAIVLSATAFVVGPVLLIDTGSDERAIEPANTPTPTATPSPGRIAGHKWPEAPGTETPDSARAAVAKVYGVFGRPARATDRANDEPPRSALQDVDFDRADARRLATLGDYALYGLPAVINGHTVLCTSMRNSRGIGGAGCSPFNADQAHTRPVWQRTTFRPAPVISLLIPDGTDTVQVHLKSGKTHAEPVQDNAVLVQAKGFDRITWRDQRGNEHSTQASP